MAISISSSIDLLKAWLPMLLYSLIFCAGLVVIGLWLPRDKIFYLVLWVGAFLAACLITRHKRR